MNEAKKQFENVNINFLDLRYMPTENTVKNIQSKKWKEYCKSFDEYCKSLNQEQLKIKTYGNTKPNKFKVWFRKITKTNHKKFIAKKLKSFDGIVFRY